VAALVDDERERPLVVIAGPTASGKSGLAVWLAERFGGEIVSCDSVAVYRGMEIGTAKPSREDRERVPHHLIDVVDPSEAFTAGDFSRMGREALAGISERGSLPIVAGGTGLYLRALLDGLFPAPPAQPELRERLRARDSGHLHRVLTRLDPVAAGSIHANDKPKLVRAIEVSLAASKPMTELWEAGREALTGYRILRIGLRPERGALYSRIDRRAAAMFEVPGIVEETAALLTNYGEQRPLGSLGYAEAGAVLRGEMGKDEAVRRAQQGHRNYAKRQGTWFRREPGFRWVDGFGDEVGVRAELARVVGGYLAQGVASDGSTAP
jgi:tRNA dimethylallyltransferase